MFTGIVEAIGKVRTVESAGTNRVFWIESPISHELKVDQSLSHDGVCLTVEEIHGSLHRVTAIEETLKKTSLSAWESGTLVNLERSLTLASRLDGHMVQGHVDATGECTSIETRDGSTEFTFKFPKHFAPLVIEKGSICVNGVSLTAFGVKDEEFKVAIIPYTIEHTNLKELKKGSIVNIEFDMVGKYITRKLTLQ